MKLFPRFLQAPEGDDTVPGAGTVPGTTPEPQWYETIISKSDDGTEKLSDPAAWLDKAPKPLGDFVRANMTAARQKTEGMLKLPGAEATPEEWQSFYRAAGAPEKGADYGLARPEGIAEDVKYDEVRAGKFADFAATIGLTKSQALALQKFDGEHVTENLTATRALVQAALDTEKTERTEHYGATLDDAITKAQGIVKTGGLNPEVVDPNSTNFWGNEFLKFVTDNVSKWVAEPGADGGQGVAGSDLTIAQAKDIMGNAGNSDHAAYQKKEPELLARISAAYKRGV